MTQSVWEAQLTGNVLTVASESVAEYPKGIRRGVLYTGVGGHAGRHHSEACILIR